MILALHLADINGHPYSAHAIGAEGPAIVCQIGPALVRPQDWKVPEGTKPHSHRDCVRFGLPMRELFAAILRMAECADTFIAHDMEATDFRLRAWCATDKALTQWLQGWARPGPERIDLRNTGSAALPRNASDVLDIYNALQRTGAAA